MIRQRHRKGAVPRISARRFAALFLLVCLCFAAVLCACGTDDPGVLPAPSISEREESAFSGPQDKSGDAFPQESPEPGGHYESGPESFASDETSENGEPSENGESSGRNSENSGVSGENSVLPSEDEIESSPDAGPAESSGGQPSSPPDIDSEDGSGTGQTDPPVSVREKRIITFATVNDLHGHIEQDANGKVPVVIYKMTPNDEGSLDRFEGCPRYYYKREFLLPVWGPKGRKKRNRRNCIVYVLHENRTLGWPTSDYYRLLDEGYERWDFDKVWLQKALSDSMGEKPAAVWLKQYKQEKKNG